MATKYMNTWKTCVKLAWAVPRATRSYFLGYLAGGLVTSKIVARYSNFYKTLLSSPCKEVAIMARIVAKDIRTTTARNLSLLEVESGGLTWASPAWRIRKSCMTKEPVVPEVDSWRVPYLGKLLEQRDQLVYQGETADNFQELIESLCIN